MREVELKNRVKGEDVQVDWKGTKGDTRMNEKMDKEIDKRVYKVFRSLRKK